MLHGRDGELAAIEELLAGAREGRSAVLLVRGEAGIGKSALLDHAAASAAGLRVVRGTGVASEAELPFAALHLLLRPLLDRVGSLPAVQAKALRAALGLVPADAGDGFLVGLAVLSLLSELAERQPVLCLIDDAQDLDRTSADALLFAARRLDAEGVVMVFAARDGEPGFPAPGLPELRLRGLDERAAAGLLGEHGGALSTGARHRVLSEAAGNPLGLIELPKALGLSTALGGGAPPAGALPLTDRLRETFRGQVERLPEAARMLLLVTALEDTGDLGVVLAAAERFGASLDDLGVAERAGLVRAVDGVLRLRHPLLRASVADGSPLSLRIAAHAALATALSHPADADRRAWHLAAAATGPDEEVAAELERTAGRARHRSGYSAAASAYERAARLTPPTGPREHRLTLAAEAAAEAGELDRAARLAEQAAGLTDDPALRAGLTEIRAAASFWGGSLGTAYRLLMDGAGLTSAADPHRTASMLIEAVHVAWYSGERQLSESVERLAAVPLAPEDPLEPQRRLLMLAASPIVGRAATGQADPMGSAGPMGSADPDAMVAAALERADGPADQIMVAGLALILGHDAVTLELASSLGARAREEGRIGWLPQVLFYLSSAQVFTGRHGDALTTATEALAIARDTGQRQWAERLAEPLAHLAAVEGDEALCRELTDEALARATTGDPGWEVPWVYHALGVLDLGLGRAETAMARLETLARGRARFHISAIRSTPDLVEAAVRVGGRQSVAEAFGQYEMWARHTRQPWIDALTLRCRALLAVDTRAAEHYEAALLLHAKTNRPFEHARTALLYGEWLRRARRKAEARVHLRTALEIFERLGATPWAERARTELGATGTAAPRQPAPGALAGLTPQELQIVRLAAQGLSNRDIAAQLFLSPRTVGYHLYKAYPKLGVSSRGELAGIVTAAP